MLPEEDGAEFAALAAAFADELVPAGAVQRCSPCASSSAAWRLKRAERLEVERFAEHRYGVGRLGSR